MTSIPVRDGAQPRYEAVPTDTPLTVCLADSGAELDTQASLRLEVSLPQPRDLERVRALGVTVLEVGLGQATEGESISPDAFGGTV